MRTGIGRAHGKIILIGEHSVVYGEKAIAIPFFPTQCTVTVSGKNETIISSSLYEGNISDAPIQLESIISLIKELTKALELPSLHYEIDSNISIAAGMGSSAAISSAIVAAVYNYKNIDLSDETRFNWIQFSETIAHGNPSGIDALTTTHNKAWVFQKGQKPIEFNGKINGYLIVGQSGEIGNTKVAVSLVRKYIDEENKISLIKELGMEVENTLEYFKAGDIFKLGKSLNKAHSFLKAFGVSTSKLDKMVDIALNNGASGAKLTGGGLGGCVIAISEDESYAINIKNLWEIETGLQAWILNLNEER